MTQLRGCDTSDEDQTRLHFGAGIGINLGSSTDNDLKIHFFKTFFLKLDERMMIKLWHGRLSAWLIMTARSKTGIVDANYDDHRIWA